jgi:hypothetical protein
VFANDATLEVVRANEKEPLAGGGVRVDRENGDTRCNGLINAVLEQGRIRNGQQDARDFLLHRLIQSCSLGLGAYVWGPLKLLRTFHASAALEKPAPAACQ